MSDTLRPMMPIDALEAAQYAARNCIKEPGMKSVYELVSFALDALRANQQEAAGWRVKKLEWNASASGDGEFAHTALGTYFYLHSVAEGWALERHEGSSITHSLWPTSEAAKDFAATKWQELVGSAIEPSPSLQPQASGDWMLVPREPTEAMKRAGNSVLVTGYAENDFGNGYSVTDLATAYRAMLAASPVPESEKA